MSIGSRHGYRSNHLRFPGATEPSACRCVQRVVRGLRWRLPGSFVDLAQLALAFADDFEKTLDHLNSRLLGLGLQDGKTTDRFLGLCERSVGDRQRPVRYAHTRAQRPDDFPFLWSYCLKS